MGKHTKSSGINALTSGNLVCGAYKPPEFKTLSAAKAQPKPAKKRFAPIAEAFKNKEFSAENLFLTDG